jgi:L-fucose mutarotase
MLRGIPPILSPEFVKVLMSMGHGDDIVLADANFPSESCGQRVVRCDGHGIPELLEAILPLFPLDTFVEQPAALMAKAGGDSSPAEIWETYRSIIRKYHELERDFEFIERFAFYKRSREAFAVVATGETALYANVILKKGVIEV